MNIYNLSLPKTATTSIGIMAKDHNFIVCDGHWRDHKTNLLIYMYLKNDHEYLNKIIKNYNFFSDLPFSGTKFYSQVSSMDKCFLVIRNDQDWLDSFKSMVDWIVCADNAKLTFEKKIDKCFQSGRYGFSIWAKYFFKNGFSDKQLIFSKREYEKNVCDFHKNNNNFMKLDMDSINKDFFKNFLGFDTNYSIKIKNKKKFIEKEESYIRKIKNFIF
jgi:hypothetical protein